VGSQVSQAAGLTLCFGSSFARARIFAAMVMYVMSDLQYQAVYNMLSFALASMMATTMYLWFRSTAVHDKYKSAVLISGLVTFIAAYHYIRIFNSWVDAYHYPAPGHYVTSTVGTGKDATEQTTWETTIVNGALEMRTPELTGIPFNDAYRYMDWLLTVPLLLIEILLVMNLDAQAFNDKAWTLGFGSALMIASGYYGELVVTGDLTPRWMCWFISMIFFLYIVYELLVGLAAATNTETDKVIKEKIGNAQTMTVISWCTYPVVYLFPMLGINAAHAILGIQIGYCVSDIISKCGVGLLIYQISYAKSNQLRAAFVKTASCDLEDAQAAFEKAQNLKNKVQAEFKQAKKEVADSSRSRSVSPGLTGPTGK